MSNAEDKKVNVAIQVHSAFSYNIATHLQF